jgi:hypothetical protein
MFSEILHLWSLAIICCYYSAHRTLLQILQDTNEDEIEFDKTGSWKPVEKKSADDVIDLTTEDEDNRSP